MEYRNRKPREIIEPADKPERVEDKKQPKPVEGIRARKNMNGCLKPIKNVIPRPNAKPTIYSEGQAKSKSAYEEVPREFLYAYPGSEVAEERSEGVVIDGKVVNVKVSLRGLKTTCNNYVI